MRVFVTGATGVLGRSAVAALVRDGHEVSGLARCDDKARTLETLGATPVLIHLFDEEGLATAMTGFDAVCNLVTHVPTGMSAMRPGAWKVNDRLRTDGSRLVSRAAREAGVGHLVQESVSFMYADAGDDWITESSPLAVTRAVEPAVIAETNACEFSRDQRRPVILRFGHFVGDDPMTRWRLAQARAGRPIGLGQPGGWAHVVHPDDAGSAVAAAVHAPGDVYNVGAEPVTREDVTQVFAHVVGRSDLRFMPRLMVRMAGERFEPLTRSHRVSSAKLHETTGWKPVHHAFDQAWLSDLMTA
ncbi:MAG: NAD-dependent epimerase/dehydratase family protein [Nocardioidaceae bacterium]